MMLWNLIRDFIVQHITGGVASNLQNYNTFLGDGVSMLNGELDEGFTNSTSLLFQVSKDTGGYTYYLSFADWLATTLTAISIIFILVACVMFVVKMIKLVGNLVK